MNSRLRSFAAAAAFAIVVVVASPAGAVAAKSGAVCKTVGAKSSGLICTKTAKGIRWTKTTSKPSPTTLAPSVAGATTAAAAAVPTSGPTSTPITGPIAAPSAATRRGSFSGAAGYRAAGSVEIVRSGSSSVLRIRDAAIQNGPALVLYLTPKSGAQNIAGAVAIGALTSNAGTSEYDVPAGVDAGLFEGVLIWCDRFGVPFGTAALS